MRTSVTLLTILLTLFAASGRAAAQTAHTAPQSALDAAVQEHADRASADRQRVLSLLARDEVKRIAAGAGLDLRRAASAVATLDDQALAPIAEQARQAEAALAGGQSRVVISTTTIIIGLLVLILIIVAVD